MHQGDVGCRSGVQETRVGKMVIRRTDMGEVACSTRREKGAAESHTEVRAEQKPTKKTQEEAAIDFQGHGEAGISGRKEVFNAPSRKKT